MADIVEGDLIQASWFNNIDSTGVFKKDIEFLNDANPINIVHNSENLMRIDTEGNTSIKGALDEHQDNS